MTDDKAGRSDELPPTPLASLVAEAKGKMAPKPDHHGPAALKSMAAIVRDLKGMPDVVVTRDNATQLRIGRRGKVGFVVVSYDAAIASIEMSVGGFSEPREPGAPTSRRYALHGEAWLHMDGGEDLFADLREHMLRLYPELAR